MILIKCTRLKYIRQHNYPSQTADNINTITNWLTSAINREGIFCSLRWYVNTPTTDTQLISRLHNTFNKLFQKLLGSHWFKLYKKHFNLIVVKELGKSYTDYHAHIALGIKSDKFTVDDLIEVFIKVQHKIKAEVYIKTDGEDVKLSGLYPDNIVISPIYYVGGISEYISKEFELSESDSMSFVSADNMIFDYQIFN